ncbi:arginyl-tRNA synthetase [Thermus arciformis]|uniref:Arginine--tRNA ligase n=1 Tax=Thermus arciformis TaxID=482827 RepID=A0A1G7J4G1_9DEIN|nr:arginine--tRNA ligase [Thermus arciformis]SDF19810.1 arginyl-tRNA synthetase [Thermus arciformis]
MVRRALEEAVHEALKEMGLDLRLKVAKAPKDKPGDYGVPLFALAKELKKPPQAIAEELKGRLRLPPFVEEAIPVGGYLNFRLSTEALLKEALKERKPFPKREGLVLIEHTSVNPNKELHVGHLRNIALGDALARILAYAGREVLVLNYIDDTGRQAAETLFALRHYGLTWDGKEKYDHFAGRAYVRLHQDPEYERLQPAIEEVLHALERGELREEVNRILLAQMATMHALNAHYDLLVWESDIVRAGLLGKALELLEKSPHVFRPTEGKYAGALVMDASPFIPGLEDPYFVLVRSGGAATYYAKDIAFQFWKMGLLEGLRFRPYENPYYPGLRTSAPEGEAYTPKARETINVIDVRQSHPQALVRAALALVGHPELAQGAFHLAYETVLLEGKQMSGRKGLAVSVDEVLEEARKRALAIVEEKNPGHPNKEEAARMVALGAIRFAMVKTEPKKQIDFRYAEALSFEGDTGPYLQYAHARAHSILRKAEAWGSPDLAQATPYERELALALLDFEEAVLEAAEEKTPHVLAQYLLDLAAAWNAYYNAKEGDRPATPVLTAPPGLRELRLELVRSLKETLRTGLGLLGLPAPEVM